MVSIGPPKQAVRSASGEELQRPFLGDYAAPHARRGTAIPTICGTHRVATIRVQPSAARLNANVGTADALDSEQGVPGVNAAGQRLACGSPRRVGDKWAGHKVPLAQEEAI